MRLTTKRFHQISPERLKIAVRSYSLSSFFDSNSILGEKVKKSSPVQSFKWLLTESNSHQKGENSNWF